MLLLSRLRSTFRLDDFAGSTPAPCDPQMMAALERIDKAEKQAMAEWVAPKIAEMLTTDILIKSYPQDYPLLEYCLKSLSKFATGFRQIIVVCPEKANLRTCGHPADPLYRAEFLSARMATGICFSSR